MHCIHVHWVFFAGVDVRSGCLSLLALRGSNRPGLLICAIGWFLNLLTEAIEFLVELGGCDKGEDVGSSELGEDVLEKLGG
jgi:hypothetical protein